MNTSPHTHVRTVGWFDHPVLSLSLGVTWLMLSQSLALVHLLSAVLIGLAVPKLIAGFLKPADGFHWPSAIRLVGVVMWDIVLSNIAVARLVLGPIDKFNPMWFPVPLATKHARVNALFASIITTTPGTVSCLIDEHRDVIWVHALDGADPESMANDMKQRYEVPLMHMLRVKVDMSVEHTQ